MPTPPWQHQLTTWLEPFLERLGRPERQHWAHLYLQGLILPGERKSIEPIATRVCPGDVQQLHHFISTSPWNPAPLQEVLFHKVDALVGGKQAALLIDDTALVKQGKHSVGVTRQYCGELGKKANCQCLVTLTLAREEVPVPIWTRLFLPESWASDPARCDAAGIPESERVHLPKWNLTLLGVQQALQAGVRFGWVAADSEYSCAAFRSALRALGVRYAVGILPQLLVYPEAVAVLPPVAKRPGGRTPKHPTTSLASMPAKELIDSLGDDAFPTVSWRAGTQGRLSGRFAAVRVRVADGTAIGAGRHLPNPEVVWLVCEQRTNERKYYLVTAGAAASLRTLVRMIKARWSCEQAHEQLKNDLGLDHLECRNWVALQHHTLLVIMAMAFLQTLRLGGKKEAEGAGGSAAESVVAGGAAGDRAAG